MQPWLCKVRSLSKLCALACLLTTFAVYGADDAPPKIISANPAFEHGLAGWQVSGDVHLDPAGGVRLGPGFGAIRQRFDATAVNHMQVSVLASAGSARALRVIVRCLDHEGHELMSLATPGDIRPDEKKADDLEDYFRPHPFTQAIELIVAKDADMGTAAVQHASVAVYDDDDPSLASTQNESELMRPFWQGDAVTGEAVLMEAFGDGPATGTLMFQPTRILSVTSYDGSVTYAPGKDYTVTGRTLVATPGSRMTIVRDADLKHGEIAWNIVGGEQVMVNYEHTDRWPGPVQPFVGAALPNTMQKLTAHAPLDIVAFGDSITYGIGSSYMRKIAPYQRPWLDLFADELRRTTGDSAITLDNASQSGADSNWAAHLAGRMVANLHPDLVIVAFGQNDFWRISPDDFAANIAAVIRIVRAASPQAEFLLVSTLRFDPVYSAQPDYWNLVTQYDAKLRAMTGPGVQLVDMTAISGAVYAAKAPKDCLNDPLHPNDYFSRWYAQSMMAALTPDGVAGGH
ncbi:MAG TPA: SGNH/GDSL hydrolase family protein [Acidobacteriaceae bacterium]|nr:SGNH/GDSL hydrolase family protein [Acidobacteriaceae bacterium]